MDAHASLFLCILYSATDGRFSRIIERDREEECFLSQTRPSQC
jgi:hypothetical protein